MVGKEQPNLAEIKARAQAATPGPWFAGDANGGDPPHERRPFWVVSTEDTDPDLGEAPEEWAAEIRVGAQGDAEFIAHAREDVPALVAEVERLQTALGAIQAVCPAGHVCHDVAHATLDGGRP